MKATELAQKAKQAAGVKTLYILGCCGAPMNSRNKSLYTSGYSYNKTAARKQKIQAASADTFGFDCSGLIKGLLWGWNGDASHSSGGAAFKSNDVPDKNANGMIQVCSDVSTDFSTIAVGEVVWMSGHIGIYIGDGLAVEASPKWADGVQITAVLNIGKKTGYNGRSWTKHGKLPYVTYEAEDKPTAAECTATISLPILEKGAEGEPVKALQHILHDMGYSIGSKNPIDGKFGPMVEKAVCSFQEKKQLPATGKTDAETWKALLGV